ncbi:MAG: hypothetical protein NTX25_10545 [Proteobacteria bacterium]|nr:hypothetical protein [Pseudomonadota bacterium]
MKLWEAVKSLSEGVPVRHKSWGMGIFIMLSDRGYLVKVKKIGSQNNVEPIELDLSRLMESMSEGWMIAEDL